jgi:hypothetical protein
VSLAAIRQGLATNLSTIPEVQVSPYIINPTPPTIWVATIQIEYDKAMGSRLAGFKYTDEYTATIQAMADFTDPQRGQEVLDQFMAGSGAYSIKDALEADRTLAGAADDIWVSEATGPSLNTFQTLSLLLSEWTVTIISTEVAL